jgi:collagenase-like PrtC family protease
MSLVNTANSMKALKEAIEALQSDTVYIGTCRPNYRFPNDYRLAFESLVTSFETLAKFARADGAEIDSLDF